MLADNVNGVSKIVMVSGLAMRGSRLFDEGKGLSTQEQQYAPTSIINEVRGYVDT